MEEIKFGFEDLQVWEKPENLKMKFAMRPNLFLPKRNFD
jgi:hypothetical protein